MILGLLILASQALRDELSNEASINRLNEKYIKDLEQWEKAELRSEISSLRIQIYNAKKEVRDKASHIANIEKQLQESEEHVQNLRYRFKVISSRRSSPSLYNSEEEDTDMAHIDPFVNIRRGLVRLENHFRGGTPLNNPANIVQGIYGTLNTIRANYQRKDQDLDDITNQRDDQDAQITTKCQPSESNQSTYSSTRYLANHVNQLIPERDTLQNHVNQLIPERDTLQNCVNQLAQDLNNSQQRYNLRGHLWFNASLIWDEQSKLKHVLEIIYKAFIHHLEQELQQCRADKGLLEYNQDQLFDRY
ncbi:18864_t:CDS:2 [Entrophospora sp. SA101]|nr:19483_t:CDS:2 [Entrophospora sp. SA101]CAJ0925656.1 18864_t:CDS:2 [Entrophospora sp. SA101]